MNGNISTAKEITTIWRNEYNSICMKKLRHENHMREELLLPIQLRISAAECSDKPQSGCDAKGEQ